MNGRLTYWTALAAALVLATACQPPEGDAPRRLTTHPGEDRSPAWSPAGERLLFASDRSGDFEIYSIGRDGRGLQRRTHDPGSDRSPAWSPDGRHFVFQSDRGGEPGLWIREPTGGRARRLLADASPELAPDWSPDGEWIAFSSERSGAANLYRVRVADGHLERLTESKYRDVWPRYSGDGDRIVFFSRRATEGEHDDLFILDLADRSVHQVTDHPTHHDFAPDFEPAGARVVAAMSDRNAAVRDLEVHDLADGKMQTLGQRHHRVFHPTWSPDGRSIAYAARLGEGEGADLYVLPAPH